MAMKDKLPLFYEAEVEWAGERKGSLRSPDLPSFQIAAPPEFQGHKGYWTPEHLYVASVSACFMTTFLAIAGHSKLEVVSLSVAAKAKLEEIAGRGYQITEIVLKPRLVIRPAGDLDRAARILKKTERSCPISNSIKTTVKVEPEIYTAQLPSYPCPPVV